MSRTARALAALAALVGLVLGALVCGAGPAAAVTAPTAAAPADVARPAAPTPARPAAEVTDAQVMTAGGGASPGCGERHDADGAARPATPPRPAGFGELLPQLAGARAADGGWGADQVGRDLLPGPEPPELVPPSPVELSILRV
ncbi:hypothetical protein EAO71_18170 [Streptomyces sp. ms191]|uniref:hypothetical protein n=1 Tax=unclassified Streptomyces TaxID=2593676 RepID=UPI0011CECFAF|nr:hypothetical protein [Streptomyces sp. ms191]TXS30401.1 hypothetical protein EAO71_18170 [Streptomyces sp. ms191]